MTDDGPSSNGLSTRRLRLPALDPQVLGDLERAMGDRSAVRDLLATFVEDASARCGAARTALSRGVLRDVQRAAHTIVGSAGTVGATFLYSLAQAVEQSRDLPQAELRLGRMEMELKRVEQEAAQLATTK
jgi:HPt (histidine-containing phosphotransfer) domain-containing protein